MNDDRLANASTVGGWRDGTAALLMASGVPPHEAQLTARALILAECWGLSSHGLMRLPYYLARLQAGGIRADAELVPAHDSGPVASYDGQCGMGHWQVWRAAERAAERCAEHGLAAISVGNSSHCGCLGVYTLPILDAGYLALVFSNGPAVMPPWGGGRPVLSTSPLAAGIPCRPRPAIVDMATTAVARGRIAERARRDEPLPQGWALDSRGAPTTDPAAALAGMLAPLGGAKGYALAFLVEALTGGAVGPALSGEVSDMFDATAAAIPQRVSHVVLAIDPARLDIDGRGKQRLDALAQRVADAGGRIPGARRRRLDEIADDEPLDIAPRTVDELREWQEALDVTASEPVAATEPAEPL